MTPCAKCKVSNTLQAFGAFTIALAILLLPAAVAHTSAQSSALAPGLPTIESAGALQGYQVMSMIGAWAPAKTPSSIVARLNQEIVRLLNQPDIKEKLFNAGSDVAGTSPETFAAAISADSQRFAKMAKATGIKAE